MYWRQLQLTDQIFEYLYLPGISFLLKEIGRTGLTLKKKQTLEKKIKILSHTITFGSSIEGAVKGKTLAKYVKIRQKKNLHYYQ